MQRDKALALKELVGLEVDEFEDLDISGKSTSNRPSYQRLLERLRGGDVRYVVAYDLSRITRSVGDQADFFAALEAASAVFLEASTGRTVDPSNESDELGANVLGSVNQHYRRALARKVRDALGAKVARGEMVGPVPAGYVRRREILQNGKIARTWVEPDPEKAPIIQRLFEEYASARWSFLTLARHLNAERVPMPRATHFRNNRPAAELWTADVLKDLLANPRYAGRVPSRDGQTFAGAFPAIVAPELWAAVERIRHRGRVRRLSTATQRPSRCSLAGLLRCGVCDSTMSGWTRKPDRSHGERAAYLCYMRRVARSCKAPTIDQACLEDDVRAILGVIALPEGFAAEVAQVEAEGGSADRPAAGVSLASIDGRLARLSELFELGDITRVDYLRRRDALLADRQAIETPTDTLAEQGAILRTLVDDWDDYGIDGRRELIASVLERIIVQPDGSLELVPREGWKRFVRAAIGTARLLPPHGVPSERKTGLVRINPPALRLTTDCHIHLLRRAA